MGDPFADVTCSYIHTNRVTSEVRPSRRVLGEPCFRGQDSAGKREKRRQRSRGGQQWAHASDNFRHEGERRSRGEAPSEARSRPLAQGQALRENGASGRVASGP